MHISRERFGDQFKKRAVLGGCVYYYYTFCKNASSSINDKDFSLYAQVSAKNIFKGSLNNAEKDLLKKAEENIYINKGVVANLNNLDGIHPIESYEEYKEQIDLVNSKMNDYRNWVTLSQTLEPYPTSWIPGGQSVKISVRQNAMEMLLEYKADHAMLIKAVPNLNYYPIGDAKKQPNYPLLSQEALESDKEGVREWEEIARHIVDNRDENSEVLNECHERICDLDDPDWYPPDQIKYPLYTQDDYNQMIGNEFIGPNPINRKPKLFYNP